MTESVVTASNSREIALIISFLTHLLDTFLYPCSVLDKDGRKQSPSLTPVGAESKQNGTRTNMWPSQETT